MNVEKFKESITQGIPSILPPSKTPSDGVPHAPVRKEILTLAEKELALSNALRYFPEDQHAVLAPEFAQELKNYGRIYMYRLMPDVEIKARPIEWYPAKCQQAASIMLMIQNNLDAAVAQHPQELITYGGKRIGIPELGSVQAHDEVFKRDGFIPNPYHFFRPSYGTFSITPRRPKSCSNKRNGNP